MDFVVEREVPNLHNNVLIHVFAYKYCPYHHNLPINQYNDMDDYKDEYGNIMPLDYFVVIESLMSWVGSYLYGY